VTDPHRTGRGAPAEPGGEGAGSAAFGTALVDMLQGRGLTARGARRAACRLECARAALRGGDDGVGEAVAAFQVPGRIELVGKHVDYAGGRSLVAAVERGISVMVAPAREPVLVFVDADGRERGESGARFEVPLGADGPEEGRGDAGHGEGPVWHLYPRTMVRRLARDVPGRMDGGTVVAFSSSLPQAAGLSSSTALLTALWLALDARFGLVTGPSVTPLPGTPQAPVAQTLELARYLSAVESGRPHGGLPGLRPVDAPPGGRDPEGVPTEGVGTEGGTQDHAAVLLAREGRLTHLRYRPLERVAEVPLPEGWVLVVASSGVRAEKAGAARDAYNRLSLEARDVAARWRERTGGDEPHLGAILDGLRDGDPGAWMGPRFSQFRAECLEILPSVIHALEAWDAGGPERMGRAVGRSQRLAEEILGNQIPETVFLARSARRLGAPAASAFGAGFGGAVWALVPAEEAGNFVHRWRRAYVDRFPRRATGSHFFMTPAGPGAFRVF
jgi:galactokinase